MDVKTYVKGFVTGFVGILIVVNLIPTLINATNQVSGDVPILSSMTVGTILGAGVMLTLIELFI